MSFDFSPHDIYATHTSKVTSRRRRRFRTTNHHEQYCKPPAPPPHKRATGAAFTTRAMGRWIKKKRRHKDILHKEPGDVILFTQHDYNFYTHCGFLGITYNPNKPSIKFIALIQDRFTELELSWTFEEALAVRKFKATQEQCSYRHSD